MIRWLAVLIILLAAAPAAYAQDATPASGFTMPPSNNPGWVIVPDLGPDATQTDYGEEVYRLVCKACHGDKGQGLTPDWIAQWVPEDQNCWQTKCHAANHPPDGFTLPYDIPAVSGAQVAARFPDAQRLHGYVAATMPWHAPGALSADEYWQVTAYMLKLNGIDLGGVSLSPDNAAAYRLASAAEETPAIDMTWAPATRTPQPPGTAATRQAEVAAGRAAEQASHQGWPWGWGILLLGALAGLAWVADQWMRQL